MWSSSFAVLHFPFSLEIPKPGVVTSTLNPNTRRGRVEQISVNSVSMVYVESSRTARAHRETLSQKSNQIKPSLNQTKQANTEKRLQRSKSSRETVQVSVVCTWERVGGGEGQQCGRLVAARSVYIHILSSGDNFWHRISSNPSGLELAL